MSQCLRYSYVCALLMPALSGLGCDNDYTEVVVHCPPGTECVWTCEDDECRVEYVEPDGADPGEPEASAEPDVTMPETPEPEMAEPEAPDPDVGEPEAPEPEVGEPEAPEPEAPEPEAPEPEPHTAPDACMILCAGLDKDSAVCLHEGLTALHPICEQTVQCETLTDPADCRACLTALQTETAACEAFGAICR